jgi:hypothetical protein
MKKESISSHALVKGVKVPLMTRYAQPLEVQSWQELKLKPSEEEEKEAEDSNKPLHVLAEFEIRLHASFQFSKKTCVKSSVWNKKCSLLLSIKVSIH